MRIHPVFDSLNNDVVFVKKSDLILKIIIIFKNSGNKLKLRTNIGQRKIVREGIENTTDSSNKALIITIPVLRESIKKCQYKFSSQLDKCLIPASYLHSSAIKTITCINCGMVLFKPSEPILSYNLVNGCGFFRPERPSEYTILAESFCDHNPYVKMPVEDMKPKDSLNATMETNSGLIFIDLCSSDVIAQQSNSTLQYLLCKGCGNILGYNLGKTEKLAALELDLILIDSLAIESMLIIKHILSEHMLTFGISADMHIIALENKGKSACTKIKILHHMAQVANWSITNIDTKKVIELGTKWKVMFTEEEMLDELAVEILVKAEKGKIMSKKLYNRFKEILKENQENINSFTFISYLKL